MSRLRKDIEALALGRKKAKDYDPEDENEPNADDSAQESEDEGVAFGGREHYQTVGKSKLRKPVSTTLDSKYGGVAVSRKALASDSDDDPFAADGDENEDDEDPFAQDSEDSDGVASADRGRVVRSDMLDEEGEPEASEDDENESEFADDDDDEGEESGNLTDEQMESLGNDEDEASDENEGTSGARGDLRAFLTNDTKNLAQGLSQAAIADAAKGRAVRKQYQNSDRVLDARMKLQKGLTASEGLMGEHKDADFTQDAREALRAAQESARQVFNTISSFRDSMASEFIPEGTSKKRKRAAHVENGDDVDSMWRILDRLEIEARPTRRAIIDKWSNREKAFDSTLASARPKQKFQDTSNQQDHVTAVLDVYVANEQEKQFRGQDVDEDALDGGQTFIFDDSLFYQSLLRELITSRSAASSAANDLGGALLPHKLHPSGNTENKKTIDTKASKGRKIRYTVHEKLQNFMAAEGDTGRDTAMWTERGKNEFFGSLFGQDRALIEDIDGSDEEEQAEMEALRLFRT